MPSTKKTIHYLVSAVLTAVAVGVLGFGMSTEWSTTKFDCNIVNGTNETGNAVLTLGLFHGTLTLLICPYGDSLEIEGIVSNIVSLSYFYLAFFFPLSFLFLTLQLHL